jgi:hypothetical protein
MSFLGGNTIFEIKNYSKVVLKSSKYNIKNLYLYSLAI